MTTSQRDYQTSPPAVETQVTTYDVTIFGNRAFEFHRNKETILRFEIAINQIVDMDKLFRIIRTSWLTENPVDGDVSEEDFLSGIIFEAREVGAMI